MRSIGTLKNRPLARRISDYLLVHGISNQVEEDPDGACHLWIHDDLNLSAAEALFNDFLKNPDRPEYRGYSAPAEAIRSDRERAALQTGVIDVRTHWHRLDTSVGPVTAALIVLSVALTVLAFADRGGELIDYFYITPSYVVGPYLQWDSGLPEVLHGQVWRLVTPIFLHSGLLHILFNMLWLKDLGTMVERRQGSVFFLVQVLAIAVLSNLGQFWMSGPNFGGMSGVVYGLLGYIWIRGRYDPASGLSLNQGVVTMMIVWFFLCASGLIGNIANWAHGVGLVVGMVWGFLAAKFHRVS
jgi:GlpG protein